MFSNSGTPSHNPPCEELEDASELEELSSAELEEDSSDELDSSDEEDELGSAEELERGGSSSQAPRSVQGCQDWVNDEGGAITASAAAQRWPFSTHSSPVP